MDIIFLSYGNPDYLKYVLTQCAETNKDANIHLLGDKSNYGYKGITHHLIDDYKQSGEAFTKEYIHLSTNIEKFERFCFERWFYINEFIKKQNIKQAIIIDSDVLLYDEVASDMDFFSKYDMSLYFNESAFTASAGQTFVYDTKIIDDFCNFLLTSYKEKDQFFDKAKQHYTKLQSASRTGGVCDMTYFYFFYLENEHRILDLHTPLPNNNYYDLSFITSETPKVDFKKNKQGMKHIEWEGKIPYGYLVPSNQKIKFQCLHFQGDQKQYIPEMINRKGLFYIYNLKYLPLKNKIKSLLS